MARVCVCVTTRSLYKIDRLNDKNRFIDFTVFVAVRSTTGIRSTIVLIIFVVVRFGLRVRTTHNIRGEFQKTDSACLKYRAQKRTRNTLVRSR